ncbi:hypothetical protein K461DRAFT_176498 [Myriangium duriaei CBS 260.36]|uniref:BZIP domain-containing protein n=1 Tax=Myriangium duriaei CBS 260.36 TaxID=1168546 RepID=A0A9P4IUZ2_9PEZI|nr:hypothetical protein K461DRAFT_176498 [Myriangium duriaei CBS 260.36]
MNVDFDLGFDAFGQDPDLLPATATFANPQEFPEHEAKPDEGANNTFANGLFYTESFDLSTYSANFDLLQQGILPVKSPPQTFRDFVVDTAATSDPEHNVNMDSAVEVDGRENKSGPARRNTDSSITVAQSRRKAQNRAAQRAFRERKERHVRDLESQLSMLNEKATSLQSDNERLIDLLKKAQSENKVLKARSARRSRNNSFSRPATFRNPSDESVAPLMFSRKDSFQDKMQPTPVSSTSSNTSSPPSSPWTKFLDPVATWDLLQRHPLFLKGVVDIGQVCEMLKKLARCEDSIGPVFDESDVRRVIEEVANDADTELT